MAYLVLEDGTLFRGRSFGRPPPCADELELEPDALSSAAGELVFNTGMAGYHEILTDQSYSGQIVVMTYPHIGNYGADPAWSEYVVAEEEAAETPPRNAAPPAGEKSRRSSGIKAAGLAVRSLYTGPVPRGRQSLDGFMKAHGITGITDVDTRALTLRIREQGNPIGLITAPRKGERLTGDEKERCLEYLRRFPRMEGRDLVTRLGTETRRVFGAGGSPHICVVDCGAKAGIIRELVDRGCRVTLVPNGIDASELVSMPADAVLFSNGPGDPAVLSHLIELARAVMPCRPTFGICLGHQIIGLALGGRTFKMKFGHHGVNNPVQNAENGKVIITSQNHGFAVQEENLPDDCRVWFRNVNDGTVEGLIHERLPVLAVQFHPEARPGPRDSGWIFQRFLEAVQGLPVVV